MGQEEACHQEGTRSIELSERSEEIGVFRGGAFGKRSFRDGGSVMS